MYKGSQDSGLSSSEISLQNEFNQGRSIETKREDHRDSAIDTFYYESCREDFFTSPTGKYQKTDSEIFNKFEDLKLSQEELFLDTNTKSSSLLSPIDSLLIEKSPSITDGYNISIDLDHPDNHSMNNQTPVIGYPSLTSNHQYQNPQTFAQREALSALLRAVNNQKRTNLNKHVQYHPTPATMQDKYEPLQGAFQTPHSRVNNFWSDSELANSTLERAGHGYSGINNILSQTLSQPSINEAKFGCLQGNKNPMSAVATAAYAAAKAMATLQNQNSANNKFNAGWSSGDDIGFYSSPEFCQNLINSNYKHGLINSGAPLPTPHGPNYLQASSLNQNNSAHASGFNLRPFTQMVQPRNSYLPHQQAFYQRPMFQRDHDDYLNYETLASLRNERLQQQPHQFYQNQHSGNMNTYQNINYFPHHHNQASSTSVFDASQDFRLLMTERNVPNNHPYLYHSYIHGVTGQAVIQLISGTGLSSESGILKDLYCVIESDSVRKSRSMIRTSSDFFEWNECFEIDLEDCQYLALLLYQWDPKTRHRLCFYGGINLANIITQNLHGRYSERSQEFTQTLSPNVLRANPQFEKIALQLEPKGLLYLKIAILPMEKVFARFSSSLHNSMFSSQKGSSSNLLFGVRIKELFDREIRICRIMRPLQINPKTSSFIQYVPLFIRKCTYEVDRRGLEVVGIYRLSGSILMKLHLRDLFEQATATIQSGLINEDSNAIANIISFIDLSPEKVPDIHAITAILKDFLRELPEPLFTNALYPMIHDAMQISMPGNSQNGAKLMLNILDCLPTPNQEILLYLLDHFKKVIKNSKVNKMTSHNLATCLAPVLLYPSPDAVSDLDPTILEPARMTAILKYILDIWPDSRSPYNSSNESNNQDLCIGQLDDFIEPNSTHKRSLSRGSDIDLHPTQPEQHHRYLQKKHNAHSKSAGHQRFNQKMSQQQQQQVKGDEGYERDLRKKNSHHHQTGNQLKPSRTRAQDHRQDDLSKLNKPSLRVTKDSQ